MARLTPAEILALSEPVEQVYSQIVDALLINMARHFKGGESMPIDEWAAAKLAQLGALTQESAQIIADMTGQNADMILDALRNAAQAATKEIEPELSKAAKGGHIKVPEADSVLASRRITQALAAYDSQAVDKLNLVNTTMLESTAAQFRRWVQNTVEIERQMQAAQSALNLETGRVITGVSTRQQAMRQAIGSMQKEGITGFYDRAGRAWTPEAYVNMDIRTTVHNTAIEAVRLRQEDYGVKIFRVSTHSGARPLCYPYQGRYFSWDNSSGTFTDGNGTRHRYKGINTTSYGEPAGLFGINCMHHPITVIPGVTIPSDTPKEDKKENDRIYAESQEQRGLERKIRYAKQRVAMYEAAGDKEGAEKAAQQIKDAQAEMRAFIKRTGRTRRNDREQIYTGGKNSHGVQA